jgi:hypothetical protein
LASLHARTITMFIKAVARNKASGAENLYFIRLCIRGGILYDFK